MFYKLSGAVLEISLSRLQARTGKATRHGGCCQFFRCQLVMFQFANEVIAKIYELHTKEFQQIKYLSI